MTTTTTALQCADVIIQSNGSTDGRTWKRHVNATTREEIRRIATTVLSGWSSAAIR